MMPAVNDGVRCKGVIVPAGPRRQHTSIRKLIAARKRSKDAPFRRCRAPALLAQRSGDTLVCARAFLIATLLCLLIDVGFSLSLLFSSFFWLVLLRTRLAAATLDTGLTQAERGETRATDKRHDTRVRLQARGQSRDSDAAAVFAGEVQRRDHIVVTDTASTERQQLWRSRTA